MKFVVDKSPDCGRVAITSQRGDGDSRPRA
jgi:hypothetical protein